MKKIFVRIIAHLKKESLAKHLLQFLLFFVLLATFFLFAAKDVSSNILGAAIGFLCSATVLYFGKVVLSYFEDFLKVSYDTDHMLKLYRGRPDYKKTLRLNGTEVTFAYADSFINKDYTFRVEDHPEKFFQLDDFILENYALIFSAHSNSVKFNGTTIRLDDFKVEDNVCTFYLSRSTVYNHLLTNRAIDFILFDDVTLRSIYEYGPELRPYADSKMSNHIGVNGLVFLSDGRLLVPQRNKASTISKNQITSSIAVKLDFPAKGGNTVDADHLIRGTIMDNLVKRTKLPPEALENCRIQIRFLGFGQNIYEGGKPQFYYTVHLLDIDTEQYFKLNKVESTTPMLDVDKCIHVADYSTYQFHKNLLTFQAIQPNGTRKKVTVEYELSYLSNLWHHEMDQNRE